MHQANNNDRIDTNLTRHLLPLGWTSYFENQLENVGRDGTVPARVVGVSKNSFFLRNGKKEWRASAAGRLNHPAGGLYPVTGDWVLAADAVISKVLARKNALSRGAAGARGKQHAQPHREQVIAANLDTVFVVCGLDRDFNLRRIERYLTLAYNCGLDPVIILT
ncbi:MAG: GTPase RsgA, partial [Desulfobacterales bacterium]|nr:GTPase RsgA [Desulfobacterales bacterium]